MPPLPIQTSIPWRTCGQCLRRRSTPVLRPRYLSTTRPLRTATTTASHNNPLRNSGNARSREQEVARYQRSVTLSAAGIAVCAVAMYGVIKLDLFGLEQQQSQGQKADDGAQNDEANPRAGGAMKLDGPDGFTSSPSVIRIQGQDGIEQVETGTSSVPQFPSTIRLPRAIDAAALKSGDEVRSSVGGAEEEEEEYQLLGLGIRTVSFLKIQVYVVGLYVAKSDISELQHRLVRTAVNPPTPAGDKGQATMQIISNPVGAASATSLVSTERQRLKDLLLDPEQGDEAWDAILREDGLRTVFRIVPTRNTDFLHLRDGWVRGITGRAQRVNTGAGAKAGKEDGGEFQDESFGVALNDFKSLFGGGQRKNVPKGQTLYLVRGARGELDALFQPDATKPMRFMGRVTDERISRLVWLNYLAGKNVSSEGARQSVVEGVMAIVERPVGTLIQKVL